MSDKNEMLNSYLNMPFEAKKKVMEFINKNARNPSRPLITFDPRKYRFQCERCGKCCRHAIDSPYKDTDDACGYNYKGTFTKNPSLSTTIMCYEKERFEHAIKDKVDYIPKIHPNNTVYFKDFKIGFVYAYQMEPRENGICYYYDNNQNCCNIYSFRPIICRSFPVIFSQNIWTIIAFNTRCTSFEKELERQNSIDLKSHCDFDINLLENPWFSFESEMRAFREVLINENLFELFCMIFKDFTFVPTRKDYNTIKEYKLINFTEFVKYGLINFKDDPKLFMRLLVFQNESKKIKQCFTDYIATREKKI